MSMIHDLVAAVYRDDYRIEIEFDDGERGVVDLTKHLERGGVFERFRDMEFFRSFSVNKELGTLTWGDEIDIAPETLYAEATGSALPNWMEAEDIDSSGRQLHSRPRNQRHSLPDANNE